jgi:DNA-binding NtrC family response regulator
MTNGTTHGTTTSDSVHAQTTIHAAGIGSVLGRSPAMRATFDLIQRVAGTEATVLITGESGVGKELVAELIHELSARSAGPMVAINCGSIPATLIEAELFGYEKGSFTGATRSHAGVFERANRGTLLLDEITEMPMEMQTRLLRVLETGRFFRVGGTEEIRTDIRVIAATNRDMNVAVRDRQLREDVMYRLAVFPIHVPPLRDREGDIRLLAENFLERLNAEAGSDKVFSESSLRTLNEHNWPGNVRELKNAVERAFIMADHVLELAPVLVARGFESTDGEHSQGIHVPLGSRLDEAERSLIVATLEHFDGNKRRAAQVLGCSLKTLYNKLNAYARETAWAQQG